MPKLTEDMIRELTLESGRRDRLVFDSETRGLGVRVTPVSKTFIVQWTDPTTKRKQREPLGLWGSISLKAARDAAKVKLGDVAKGHNPKAERLKRKAEADRERAELALTLDILVSDWAKLHLAHRRPRYAAEAERALRAAFKAYLNKPAAQLTRAHVVSVLDGMTNAGKVTAAGRTLAYGRAAFTWAQKRGKLDHNAFSGLPIAVATNSRDRVLSASEVREVYEAAGTLPDAWAGFYRMALLTLARRDEVAGMRRSELSADGTAWTIPGERTKNGQPHEVHLSPEACAVLAALPKVERQDLLFSSNGKTPVSGFSKAKQALDAAIVAARARAALKQGGEPEPLTPFVVHDFRRSGVSTLAALGFDPIVCDKLLNHVPAKLRGVAGVYQRHAFADERARALEAWSAFVTAKPVENVISLAERRA